MLLAEELRALKEHSASKTYFATEEGHDMLLLALDEARRTRSTEKKELYARILKGAVLDFERREYSPEEYLHLIADLTEKEVRVARSIYKSRPAPDEQSWNAWTEEACEELGVDQSDLGMALGRICSTGLIENVFAFESGQGSFAIPSGPVYRVTSAFEKLMGFLELGT